MCIRDRLEAHQIEHIKRHGRHGAEHAVHGHQLVPLAAAHELGAELSLIHIFRKAGKAGIGAVIPCDKTFRRDVGAGKKNLLVNETVDAKFVKSAGNIAGVKTTRCV